VSSPRPLTAVLAAFEEGVESLPEVAERTGLSLDVVRAAVDHLVRLGRLDAREMATGCPGGGCGSCASASPDGAPGCGASGPSARRSGPVLVSIGLPRRR